MFNYLFPILNIFDSFEKLREDVAKYGYYSFLFFNEAEKVKKEDVYNLDRVIILSEPGYGKTRLLKEIVSSSKKNDKNAIFIDLKKTDLSKDLAVYIESLEENIVKVDSEDKLDRIDFMKTEKFKLKNDKSIIICFDALDEVKKDNIAIIIEKLIKFLRDFNNTSIFISCRISHFGECNNSFLQKGFKYIKINSFSKSQVEEYLLSKKFDKNKINRIFDSLQLRNRELIIQVPRYLKMIISLAEEKGIDSLVDLKKTELFEYFIHRKLSLEGKRTNTKKIEILKRVLEKLALIMEINQANKISKDDLMTFFDDIISNISKIFLSQVKIEDLYERSLVKENKNNIEFENTEFQEYLAAKEIVRLGRSNQVLFDLAIDKELREIYPSWLNTLSFLVDLEPSLIKPILDFGRSKKGLLQLEEFHRLLAKVDFTMIVLEEKRQIFKQVFEYYQKNLIWIELDIARALKNFFDPDLLRVIKESIDARKFKGKNLNIRIGNVAYVISYIVDSNMIDTTEKKYWARRFISFVRDKKKDTVLQRCILSAFGKFKDIALIKGIHPLLNLEDDLVQQDLLLACRKIDSNDEFSIKCFVEGQKKKNVFARYGFYKINNYKSIEKLLDIFIKDSTFFYNFLDMESIFKEEDNKIIENIKSFQDIGINKKLEQILIKSFEGENWINAERSNFIKGIILLLKEVKDDYIFDLIQFIKTNKKLLNNLFSFTGIFSNLLEKKYINRFITELNTLNSGKGKNIAFQTILVIKYSDRGDAEKIYEEGRKFLRDYYEDYEQKLKEERTKPSKELKVYQEFRFKLEPEKGKYIPDIFRFYINNKSELERVIKDKDKKRLIDLAKNSVFKMFDPKEQELYIKDKSDGITYSTNEFITIFGDCLELAKELNIDISGFERKIINYIPFAYHEHLECIFKLYARPSDEDLKQLLDVYIKKRRDDLPIFRPESFIKTSEKYKIKKAVPVLKKFVDEDSFPMYVRIDALRVISKLNPEKIYFEEIFFKYYKKSNSELIQLANKANEYLIDLYSDDKAIKWRFEQLASKAFPFIEKKEVHGVSEEENELHEKKFAFPLMRLSDPKYRHHYLEMLGQSFKILLKGDEYYEYTNYLWDIIIGYYNNLKVHRSYYYLRELEDKVLIDHEVKKGVNWFNYKLRDLKRIYINYIGKPGKITECIKKYNKFKKIQYLDISTSIDLIEMIRKTINRDIVNWIRGEGAYTILKSSHKREELIQKTIKTQLQLFLQKHGFRENDFLLIREPQLLDEKRPDFLVFYGFIGPVLIEIKLVDNIEIVNEKRRIRYKKKLRQYINGFNAIHGFFLIFQTNDDKTLNEFVPKLKGIYKDCQDIDIIGINCI